MSEMVTVDLQRHAYAQKLQNHVQTPIFIFENLTFHKSSITQSHTKVLQYYLYKQKDKKNTT